MPCTLIVNPASGGYNHRALGQVTAYLSEKGKIPCVFVTADPEEISRIACEAGNNGELVVACGGDGTINAVVNGLPAGSTLALIPMGTVNVLAREIGVRSLRKALEKIEAGETKPLTVGQVSAEGKTRLFTLMAGVGIDGTVVKNVRPEEKSLLGKGAYALSLARSIYSYDHTALTVQYEGNIISCDSIIVSNASLYGGDLRIARRVNVFSPELEAIYIKTSSRLHYLETASRLILDRENSNTIVASHIEISGRKPVQIDGDFFGYSPVTIKAVPRYINVIC